MSRRSIVASGTLPLLAIAMALTACSGDEGAPPGDGNAIPVGPLPADPPSPSPSATPDPAE